MDKISYDDIIKRIGFFRTKANLSMREASLQLGYNPQFMSTIENKTIELKVKTLLDFCNMIDITPQDFFYMGEEYNKEDKNVLNLYNNNKSYQNYTLDKNGYNNIGESYGLYDAYKDKFTLPKMYKFESVFAGWKVDGIQYYKKNHALVVNLSAQFIDDFIIIDNVLIEYNKMNEKMCTIPDGVVEISNGAFKQNKFKYLTIPLIKSICFDDYTIENES